MSLYVAANYTVDDADYFLDEDNPLYVVCDYWLTNPDSYANGDDTCPVTSSTSTSAGSYNMYRPWDWGKKKRKLRKVRYLGPSNEKLTFYVESSLENRWIPTTIYKPSVLEEIERNGLIIRQINGDKLRRMIMADDEWFMLN